MRPYAMLCYAIALAVWSCGPVMALIDDIPTCDELIRRMVDEAVGIIDSLPATIER